jgi:hypothetical protein
MHTSAALSSTDDSHGQGNQVKLQQQQQHLQQAPLYTSHSLMVLSELPVAM